MHKQFEFRKQFILDDKLLTDDEKTLAIKIINEIYDQNKVLSNSGIKRICENCNQECLATLYCEYCVQNFLKSNFKNWTSGNYDIDNLIQKCQLETLMPSKVIEWISYKNLTDIKYLTKGGFSEIYTARWIDGYYKQWDSKNQQLLRFGTIRVILKRLENVESASQSWYEEAKSHLNINNKHTTIVKCFGLTRDKPNGSYMLVMMEMDMDLRKYLQLHNQLTWKQKIRIAFEIIDALFFIHLEKAIHRDLHSGNILYSKYNDRWFISDLGFCGPADKSSKSIYGNLPYIAPEVINGKGYTFKSDIYSVAILMCEISTGYPPFIDCKHIDYELAMNIINGMRPEIASDTPFEYKSLMKQCWDDNPSNRLDIQPLREKMNEIHLLYQNKPNEVFQAKPLNNIEIKISNTSSRLFTSKIYQFDNLFERKNATEEIYSKVYDFSIPDNVDDFNNSRNLLSINKTSRISSNFKAIDKGLSKVYKPLKISSKDDIRNDHKKVIMRQTKGSVSDDDEIYNNPNLHSEEQDEFEIPEGGF
ncbi:kinase-like domain-containing protein [Rhizophagus diaphanus]|nr:kinase-like domain-containing protein [Rhizophagus diaphanus] [Rhizophagus sp. MUCL 43196]